MQAQATEMAPRRIREADVPDDICNHPRKEFRHGFVGMMPDRTFYVAWSGIAGIFILDEGWEEEYRQLMANRRAANPVRALLGMIEIEDLKAKVAELECEQVAIPA